jgi:integrase
MEALLAWALRMIEEFGLDIRTAAHEARLLMDGQHPATVTAGAMLGSGSLKGSLKPRLARYASELQRTGRGLPGTRRRERHGGQLGVDYEHVARMVASSGPKVKKYDSVLLSMAEEHELELEDDAYFLGPITGTFQGAPWRDRPIGVREVNQLVRHLTAACFIVICYLSGMRSGEVLQLRRGCLREDEHGGFVLVGRRSKGSDHDPAPDREQTEERPWAVVRAVVPAVEMLESLSDAELLFPPSRQRTTTIRSRRKQSKPTGTMNEDVREFMDWVNTRFSGPDGPTIPLDPTKDVHAARFRRTLAYFVVRRPGGLAAAQAQYGHVRAKVTLGYAGDADTSWMEDLAVEELEMLSEQVDEDLRALDEGEHVSGPSAQEYRRRVRKAAAVFTGRVVNQADNAKRLLSSKHPDIHHGLGMTCVWRHETAACREEREAAGLDVTEPDEQLCRATCTNLAYTDRDIENKRRELARWEAAAADRLSPRPLRDRAAAKAAPMRAVIEVHEQGRRGSGQEEPMRGKADGAQTTRP